MSNGKFYEADVPIHNTADPARRALHVFTGEADSPTTAPRRAHEVYDAALAAHTAGQYDAAHRTANLAETS
ncbi:hypothetical protein [Streptomyces sp. NPDC059802]|uniref:hypothetical protein n=1 Tax=Streptomyces sp. NPDC059802 TaxID=3346952 RepID=UPI003655B4DB